MARLSDADTAAVLTYIRNAWGNRASGVSERICSMSIESLPSDRVEQQT